MIVSSKLVVKSQSYSLNVIIIIIIIIIITIVECYKVIEHTVHISLKTQKPFSLWCSHGPKNTL